MVPDVLYNILVNLLAAIAGGGVIAGINWSKKTWHARQLRLFWLNKNGKMTIVYPVYHGERGKAFPRNMARAEDIAAGHIITETVRRIGINGALYDDSQSIPDSDDLLLICGPRGNRLSAVWSERIKLPFKLELLPEQPEQPAQIVNIESGVRYSNHVSQNHSGPKQDFALLVRGSDKANGRKVFMLWGLKGAGTVGAARFVTNSHNTRLINAVVGKGDFAVVLRIQYDDAQNPFNVILESQVLPIKG